MARIREVVAPDGTTERRRPRLGDLWWDGERWRRWTGRRWGRAVYALEPERLRTPAPLTHVPVIARDRRDRALALAVEDQVATNRAAVLHEGPSGTVVGYLRPVSHLAHALLTLLTGGLWGLVWLAMAVGRREDRVLLEVDRWGNVWAKPLGTR